MKPTTINVYVWQDVPNWGDELGYMLALYFFDVFNDNINKVDNIKDANLVTIGSTLQHIPYEWSGVIAGTGFLRSDYICGHSYRNATVLGVRGIESQKRIVIPNITLGDPGLLAPLIFGESAITDQYDIGILPHWSDTALKYDKRFYGPWTTKFINPFQSPIQVYDQIARCSKLVTSSLHGTIVADALGIPRRIVPAWSMLNNPHEGGMFKFKDYMSVLDMEYQPEVLEKADADKVQSVQANLQKMYNSLPKYFNENNTSDH